MVLIVSMQIYVNGHDHCMGLYQENNVSILEDLCENKKMPFYDPPMCFHRFHISLLVLFL